MTIDVNAAIKIIRARLKKQAPKLSVRKGTGTVSTWIFINGSASKSGAFTEKEKKVLRKYYKPLPGNNLGISPGDRERWVKMLR